MWGSLTQKVQKDMKILSVEINIGSDEDNWWRLVRKVISVVKGGIRQVKKFKQKLLNC